GFLLPHRDALGADVLPAHTGDIGHALSGVDQERESEPLLRTDGISGLELGDLILAPSVEAFPAALEALDADRRVAGDHANVDGIVEQQPQRLEQIVCRFWGFSFRPDDVSDVVAFEARQRLVAMLAAECLDDIAAYGLGAGLEPAEFGRAIVGDNEGIDRA